MGGKQWLTSLLTMTDEQAMWRVQNQDDHEAFARVVERWEQPIWRLCTRLTGDAHRGEDIKQEVFARIYAKRKDYRPDLRFSTWLWRIALNLCYDELRRNKRHATHLVDGEEGEGLEALPAAHDGPDGETVRSEEGALVRRAVLQLPEIYRTVLVLRHYEGLKLREIAEVLEVPEGTVNSRMAEALARLSRMLEPQLDRRPKPDQPHPLMTL
ncbi:MAG: RNA polymerase sigma factor [Verrucomicrobiota bacterium]